MKSEPVTTEELDELLGFLPALEKPGREFTRTWRVGEGSDADTLTFPYPVYHDDVLAFFALAGKACWSDYGYDPKRSHEMLEDDEFVRNATLQQVKSMLTYCVRGERFCDGHWEGMLKRGRITALLRRLATLRREMEH